METGIYESLVTAGLLAQLQRVQGTEHRLGSVDEVDLPDVLSRHVREVLKHQLSDLKTVDQRLAVVNAVLEQLNAAVESVNAPPRQLLALTPRHPLHGGTAGLARPATPLSDAALLTNARGEPNLGAEIKAEMDSADRVDLLIAFVKWHGLRVLAADLEGLRGRGVPLRVISTTYMGATERSALDRLVREFGAEVRIQYDSQRTRLHAKAWMFRRHTGFDTAYVGSSNLSRAALLDGVEWNVRLSKIATPALLEKFQATFETYWNDIGYELYDPDLDRDRLDDALAEASGRKQHSGVTISLSGLQVRPFPYQAEMLEALEAERTLHDRHANLVVAATGTGKTVVAALDYQRLSRVLGGRPSLLFIAHRREILEQSLRTYREVLADGDFGELYVGGSRPERWRHVFASVQSLTSYGVENISSKTYDVVVVDEFHHAQAATYRRLIKHLEPRELLGLTATPERTDGLDVLEFFGGRTAVELRLWDALGADLLCPFHYFAAADNTDLRGISWTRGRYDEHELENIYTGNEARAQIVLTQLRDKILDPGSMRALGFCVGVEHARFMAAAFSRAGIPARAVSGDTPRMEREQALRDLRDRRVNALFAADLFNEGLDLPEVDTVLFLRPTESATVFLQQLGRGLRRTQDKAVLTVLDFVGYHRSEFSFDQKFRALTGSSRRGLIEGIQKGFPFLPSGCQIVMDRQSQAIVLENIKSQISNRWSQMVTELRSHGDSDLSSFLAESGLELSDILRKGSHSWTRLRRDAGLPTRVGTPLEEKLLKRIRALAHVDDKDRAVTYRSLLGDGTPSYGDLAPLEQRMAQMLFFSLWPDGGGHQSYAAGLDALRREPAIRDELRSVIDVSFDAARHVTVELGGELGDIPLRVHGRYQREEVLAAMGYVSPGSRKPNSFREGVLYSPGINVDAFFVTLKKSEADYSPTTMYRDYPISPTLFHWESQSTTSVESKTGQRYLAGASRVLLFVRGQQKDEFGTSPYIFLGPVHYRSHTDSRPIAITWELDYPMPADFFASASVAAS
ncbi:MAG: DUF3427 domain-containing protein [Ornithinimicrobium sp.]|uniref:DUF3427 domain-containing protein n=1 Tax=Ornithinimicrobium sp. TaxID=1977084 RepID=UPI0026E0A21C|nr:DEAD/DEAH box helicase [Ornithinimicrobium sp.]MDO5740060.1 DUF3427 domain-containing protein [Ornithinimicrobium sp.]